MKHYSAESLCEHLSKTDWAPVFSCKDANQAWIIFKTAFLKALDTIAPIKQIRVKQGSALWITSCILDKIAKRDFYFREYSKNKSNSESKSLYQKLRNEIQREIAEAKSGYLQGKLEENIGKPKKLWDSLKTLGYSKK